MLTKHMKLVELMEAGKAREECDAQRGRVGLPST